MIYATYTLQCDDCGQSIIGYQSELEALKSARQSHWMITGDEVFCLICRAVREVNALLSEHAYVSSGYVMSDGSEHVRRISEHPEYYIPIDSSMAEVQSEWSRMMRDAHRPSTPFPVKFLARPSTQEEIQDWTTA